jgi:hypothetical protein
MKRTLALLSALGMLVVLAIPAAADQHSPLDHPHTHALLIGADIEWVTPGPNAPPYVIHGFDRCVELAGGKALKHNRFHENIHFGHAGEALATRAGHLVVPLSVFGLESCGQLAAIIEATGSFPPPAES